MISVGAHRPRNVDWKRAAGLLYGDWGTSKAYVIGVAFSGMATMAGAEGYRSMPVILAVCALTALVAYNYVIVCRHFPDGGGVYSAARTQSRFVAVIGALLLVADLTVTAAMSCWAAMSYFRVPDPWIKTVTMSLIVIIGLVNFYGPKHSGNVAMVLAAPMVALVVTIVGLSVISRPGLTTAFLLPPAPSFGANWLAFTSMILALSGVEAIANLTGVLHLNPGATAEAPQVNRAATRAILVVAVEVVLGTALLGWAMLSLPNTAANLKLLHERWEDMLSVLAQAYGTAVLGPTAGQALAVVTGLVVGLLLISAVNTAIAALVGLLYMVARDGEMPQRWTRLNRHGVPSWPLGMAVGLPLVVVSFSTDLGSLMGLYAIGVVGAIAVNLGSCWLNKALRLRWHERLVMGVTFAILFCAEYTIARHKPDALFFALCVIILGLSLRGYAQRRAGLRTLTVREDVAAAAQLEGLPDFRINFEPHQKVMVSARGLTPVLQFALEEARLRQGPLYVLHIKEIAVQLPGNLPPERARWQDDPQAAAIMTSMVELGRQQGVAVVPVYTLSENPSATILDAAATLGIDLLLLGSSQRRSLAKILKGDLVNEVARNLPENIQLLIYG